MKIIIKTFASVKDICGFEEKEVVVSEGITAGEAVERLAAGFEALEKMKKTLLLAVNEGYVGREHVLLDGDVLAIFPPVSGG